MSDEHGPGRYRVVSQDEHSITCVASCECGNDDCYFVVSAGAKTAVHIAPVEVIK